MPRVARGKSESGIYHIMLRGANRQEIFYDDEDHVRFLETLNKYKEKSNMKVYGWCLMGNHVHLLVREGEEAISATIKRIGISYAWFYNRKYNTIGHLFQDRFKSENIDNDAYILTVIRYIHRNPVKAGIVKDVSEWKWSSYHGYLNKPYYPQGLLDNEYVLGILSEDGKKAVKLFSEHNGQEIEDKCLDVVERMRLTDKEAGDEIRKHINGYEITAIKSLPKQQKAEVLKKIKEIEGISLRQAARILGISHVQIFNA